MNARFSAFADRVSEALGYWWVSAIAAILIVVWTVYCAVTQEPGWFTGQFFNFPLNLITTVAELFIGFFLASAANRVERRHDVLLEHIKQLVAEDRSLTAQTAHTVASIEQAVKD